MSAALAFCIGSAPTLLTAQVAGEVRGRVTDAGTGAPIANSRVEVVGRVDGVRTATDGEYVLRGIEPGTYTLSIRALGYTQLSREVSVANGRTTVLDVALSPRVNVLGTVQVRSERDTFALNTVLLDRAQIERSGSRDVGELLQMTPGVVVTRAGGPGQPTQVSIRGSSANQVLVLIDGVSLNSAITGSADLSRVALENVERVVVRTGAQSARYGPRAMAGVIEIETSKPRQEASAYLRSGAFGEYDASLMAGHGGAVRSATLGAFGGADYRRVQGDFSYDLPAIRGGGRATRINSDAASTELLGGITLDGEFGSASLRGMWQQTERGLAGTIVQPSLTGRQAHTRYGVGGNAQGTTGHFGWTLASDITRELATFVDRAPPFGEAYDDSISATGFTASGSLNATLGGLSTSAGAELRTLDLTSSMLAPGAPDGQQLLGGWGNLRYTHLLPTNSRVDAELSARVDRNSLDRSVMLSPRGAVRVSHGALATSVSVGSGYAPATLADQFFHEGVQIKANPTLRPERTRRDAALRVSVRESQLALFTFAGEAAAFRANVDGMILWFPDFRFIWSPNNFDVKRAGWELSGKVGAPFAHVELSGGFNRTDVTYNGSVLQGQVAYRPRHTANIGAAWTASRFRLDFTNRYVGARLTVPGSALNSLTPYWMSDVRIATSRSTHGWTFSPALGIENAFNRAAAMLVDYPFPPRTWNLSVRVRRSAAPTPTF